MESQAIAVGRESRHVDVVFRVANHVHSLARDDVNCMGCPQVFPLGGERRGAVPCRSIESVTGGAGSVVEVATLGNDIGAKNA
jgi:hypothetical protein